MKRKQMAGLLGGLCLAVAASAQDAPIVRPSSRNITDLQIRGRVQTQFGFVQAENDETDESWSTMELRRVRMGMRGTLLDNFRAQVEANLVPGSGLSMRSAFIEWREHKPAYVKFGFDKPRFGFEENTSSASILTVERSLISNTFAPGAMNGLSVSGGAGTISYGAGLYADRANRNPDNQSAKYLANGSVEVSLDEWVGQRLRIRADYLNSGDENGNFGGSYDNALSASLHFAAGAFDLRAEYLTGDRRGSSDSTSGFYVTPSWRFTDKFQGVFRFESASSDRSTGLRAPSRYVRRVPGMKAPEDGPDPTRGDGYTAFYVGANYYLAGDNNKLMLGVEISELDHTSAGSLKATSLYGAWRMLF